ncbi:hypothetical protein [Corynebacterium belfantii]|uniref:hypothetical protein n=1 Tax=Corynebacterium belfantii TaxID=2014537 RepID=UPI003530D8AF
MQPNGNIIVIEAEPIESINECPTCGQPGKTMNKCCKDIFAYFDHYILWCLIHAANIRHTINAP